jgi:phthiodiolone/phenolphthiodiolone dimycocerosates ketoreductase
VIREAARAAGRDPERITPAFDARVVLAPSEGEARAMLGTRQLRSIALMASAELWCSVGATHPFGADFRGFSHILSADYDTATIEAALAAVPVELMTEVMIWGTPEQVVAKLRDYGAAGLRHVVVALVSALTSRRAALYGARALRDVARELRHPG